MGSFIFSPFSVLYVRKYWEMLGQSVLPFILDIDHVGRSGLQLTAVGVSGLK